MVAHIESYAKNACQAVYRQETVVLISVTVVAHSVFGKKGIAALSSLAYIAFYCRKFITLHSVALLSSIISLPLCGFLASPVMALISGLYLSYYILKNNYDLIKLIALLQQQIKESQKDTQAVSATAQTGEAALLLIDEFIKTIRQNTQNLLAIERQERATREAFTDIINDHKLQQQLEEATQAQDSFKKLTADLGPLSIQVESDLKKLEQLNNQLWAIIEILQTIINQRQSPSHDT